MSPFCIESLFLFIFLLIVHFCFFFGLCLLVFSFALYFWWMGSHPWFLFTWVFFSFSPIFTFLCPWWGLKSRSMLGDFHTYIYVCVYIYILGELLLNQLSYCCKNQLHSFFLKQKIQVLWLNQLMYQNFNWFSNLLVLTKVTTIDYFQWILEINY